MHSSCVFSNPEWHHSARIYSGKSTQSAIELNPIGWVWGLPKLEQCNCYFIHCLYDWEKRNTFDRFDVRLALLHDTSFLVFPPWAASPCFFASAKELFFPAAQIQRNLLRLSVFRHRGWSSTIPEALGSAVISWLSEHNGWKLSYYLSVLSKGKGSCGTERPRKTLALILLKGVGQPSQILFS